MWSSPYRRHPKPVTSAEFDDSLDHYGGRRTRAYVRFDPTSVQHAGPMFGPYDGLDVEEDLLRGWKKIGPHVPLAERRSDGLWYVCDSPSEPGYHRFSVVFS